MSKKKDKESKKAELKAGSGKKERTPFQMADRMARALAEGNLDEFLEKELPGNEKAKKLAHLMSGWHGQPMTEPGSKTDATTSEAEKQRGQVPLNDEKEVLDELGEIASANGLSIDWVVKRALKVYISEYHRTGKL